MKKCRSQKKHFTARFARGAEIGKIVGFEYSEKNQFYLCELCARLGVAFGEAWVSAVKIFREER